MVATSLRRSPNATIPIRPASEDSVMFTEDIPSSLIMKCGLLRYMDAVRMGRVQNDRLR
jgi:hypothetical protein